MELDYSQIENVLEWYRNSHHIYTRCSRNIKNCHQTKKIFLDLIKTSNQNKRIILKFKTLEDKFFFELGELLKKHKSCKCPVCEKLKQSNNLQEKEK